MAHKEPSWGFWIPVTNKSSAEYAAKMSGLRGGYWLRKHESAPLHF